MTHYDEARDAIRTYTSIEPEIGLILGSGLGVMADDIENPVVIPYHDIPHFPVSTVAGHKGQLVIGTLHGKNVIAMQGRFHYYEGYTMEQVTFPVRVMKKLGIHSLLITNAAGGINEDFSPGDLMVIKDHINFFGDNPLIGENKDEFGPRFPDMSTIYDKEYIEIASNCAKELAIRLQTGVYAGNSGPTYETPQEIKMLRTLGGDAVGMSTVPEAIVGAHTNLRILGISCISNMASGILDEPLSHDEVIDTTKRVEKSFINLVHHIIDELPNV